MRRLRLRIIHFDVSQGESTLISVLRPGDGTEDKHVLIDGGYLSRGKYVARCLAALKVRKLHRVICTHFDGDHSGGLVTIVKTALVRTRTAGDGAFTIDGVLVPPGDEDKLKTLKDACIQKKVPFTIARKDTVIFKEELIGDDHTTTCQLELVFVGTPRLNDSNWASIASKLTMNRFSYYTAGDLPKEEEDKLVLGHVCAFKCGHHGAETSTSQTFLDGITPSAAFISAGRHNHGHPNQDVVSRMCKTDSPVQLFYSTNCEWSRAGFLKGPLLTTTVDKARGVVASKRQKGVLGHIVLYTDEKMSRVHDGTATSFCVLVPPSSEVKDENRWRVYQHRCPNKAYQPAKDFLSVMMKAPLSTAELPEYRLTKLSPTIQKLQQQELKKLTTPKKLRTKSPEKQEQVPEPQPTTTFTTRFQDFQREPYKTPGSPLHMYLQDEPNFSKGEHRKTKHGTSSGSTKKRKPTEDMEHASGDKLDECIGCGDGWESGLEERRIPCAHDYEWYVCEGCADDFEESDQYDCGS